MRTETRKNVKKRSKKQKKKRSLTGVVTTACLASFVFYVGFRLTLHNYNTGLSVQNQALTDGIAEMEDSINELQSEVNVLQEKTRVLGLLDNQVYDNQNNIYVIDNE